METRHYWEENGHGVKYDNYSPSDGFTARIGGDQLNFAAHSEDEAEYPAGGYLKKGKQDPMSHRIIEKRRRDRMNNCLADLSRLIPPEYLKKGRGRVEKTEIIEMAIRHLKYLQDRVNVVERQTEDEFRAGYQEAVGEAVRFLVEVQGYGQNDGLCESMSSHLQRHCEVLTKGESIPREKPRLRTGLSLETTSSSSSSLGYSMKAPVITQTPLPAPPTFVQETYQGRQPDSSYAMECDRESEVVVDTEPLPLDGRRKCEPTLRTVRKNDNVEDYLHSYKFKNSIERRFSRSQDEAAEQTPQGAAPPAHGKAYTHKRRRANKPIAASTSTSASTSGSTEDARDTSPQDTSSESPHHHHFEKLPPQTQYVPVFALNALGKYYVPLSVEYSCLARHLGPYDILDARAVHLAAPLHPVTIHVNFQPCLNYHVKREPNDREWRAI